MPLAYAYTEEVYPHLLRPELNFVPFWHSWKWEAHHFFMSLVIPFYLAFALLTYALTPRLRQQAARRKRLAALLSAYFGLAPGGLGAFLEDDESLCLFVQRFLAEHDVPYPVPYYDAQGRYLFAAPHKVDVLAAALLQAVSRGHDNELFVLFADLFEIPEHLDPLVRAVRVALARHHQVLIICPWPPGLPLPGAEPAALVLPSTAPGTDLRPILKETTAARFSHAFQQVRLSFARMGIPVICAQGGQPVRLILDRLDRLRAVRRRR